MSDVYKSVLSGQNHTYHYSVNNANYPCIWSGMHIANFFYTFLTRGYA